MERSNPSWETVEIYARKKLGNHSLPGSQWTMNLVQPLIIYFASLLIVFIVRSYVAANVSKYGGKFLDEKMMMK